MSAPECHKHTKSKVVRAGWYGTDGNRRQRWLCTPRRGRPHRFVELAPRIVRHDGAGHVCDHCATSLEKWQGQPAPQLYGFTAAEVAAALTRVAAGATYRSVAGSIRKEAGRPLSTNRPNKTPRGRVTVAPNNHAQLVSDWVDVFAPVLWAAYAPKEWPAWVVVDDKEFQFRPIKRVSGVRPSSRRAFVVLAAMGHVNGAAKVVAVESSRTRTRAAWRTFLSHTPGIPERVVGDGGEPLEAAGALWGSSPAPPLLVRCQYHLGTNLRDKLPRDIKEGPTYPDPETGEIPDPLKGLVTRALYSAKDWQALVAEVQRRQPAERRLSGLLRQVELMDSWVPQHLAAIHGTRGPTSNGSAETFVNHLAGILGDRAHGFTNKKRTDAVLMLLAMQHNGWVDQVKWAKVIREHVVARKGRPLKQRRHVDPLGKPSLRPR